MTEDRGQRTEDKGQKSKDGYKSQVNNFKNSLLLKAVMVFSSFAILASVGIIYHFC